VVSPLSSVWAQDYIVPPMVDIPTGKYMMGSEVGAPNARPLHSKSIDAFKLGKYAITVAEFRIFAEETGFNPESTCGDFMDSNGLGGPTDLGTGRWDKHRYTYSEYQPITCINWHDANDYADWLSKKTGVEYRLPTEEEWEYAAKGNTSSRYFWGNDFDVTQACTYGNFADETGEYVNNKKYALSNVGWIEHGNCDDGEAYTAIVGMYRANPFGLYDILGNASEFLNSCYFEDGYKPRSKEKMDVNQCEFIAHRGGGWHYPAQPVTSRGRYKREGWNRLSDITFRLATNDPRNTSEPSTVNFEKNLKKAQNERLLTRAKLPTAPSNLQLIEVNSDVKNTYKLSWQPSEDQDVIGYDIYQNTSAYGHLFGGYYQKHYTKTNSVKANVNMIEVNVPNQKGSFRVVAKTNKLTSLPSMPIPILVKPKVISLPGKVLMHNTAGLKNTYLSKSIKKDNPTPFYISKVNKSADQSLVTATFDINVKEAGWYNVNYRGRTFKTGKFFKLWQNNTLLGQVSYDAKIDDKQSNRHQVFLKQGASSLQLSILREGFDMWNITWLEFNQVEK
jgi:formylglycine-generating enzyme required for sulfatase activity